MVNVSEMRYLFLISILTILIIQTIWCMVNVPHLPYDRFLCWLNETADEVVKDELYRLCFKQNLDSIHLDSSSLNVLGDDRVTLTKENYCNMVVMVKMIPESYPNCSHLYDSPKCPGGSNDWAETKKQQVAMFYDTADFGYIEERRRELKTYCQPRTPTGSSLQCTNYLRYCIGRNLVFDFNNIKSSQESLQYREDILRSGDIEAVDCDYKQQELMAESEHKSPLMSWFTELSTFEVVNKTECDIVIDKPVVIMKLDATVNMYHHFCDFLNLYLSQHLNRSNFDLDVQILTWDDYGDLSNFASIWKVFTTNSLMTLRNLAGSRVCFLQSVMFSLPPRMIYGLYYNMPLVPGCQGSGLIRAFNRHLLTRLGLPISEDIVETLTGLRITFISRSTKYRRVLNEGELIEALRKAVKKEPDVVGVQVFNFNHKMPFEDQIRITSATDLLIGIHGAGLTHTLFQPDWGSLFELYNCEDRDCYHDLSRLRGTHYVTWTNRTKLTSVAVSDDRSAEGDRTLSRGATHAKFVNYRVEVEEFLRLALKALDVTRQRRQAFIKEMGKSWWWTMFNRNSNRKHPPVEASHRHTEF